MQGQDGGSVGRTVFGQPTLGSFVKTINSHFSHGVSSEEEGLWRWPFVLKLGPKRWGHGWSEVGAVTGAVHYSYGSKIGTYEISDIYQIFGLFSQTVHEYFCNSLA